MGIEYRYELDMDSSLMGYRILKLTLQPLVENALFHGITPHHEGIITIKGRLRKVDQALYP